MYCGMAPLPQSNVINLLRITAEPHTLHLAADRFVVGGSASSSHVVSRQIQLRLYVRGINLIRHYKIMTRAAADSLVMVIYP